MPLSRYTILVCYAMLWIATAWNGLSDRSYIRDPLYTLQYYLSTTFRRSRYPIYLLDWSYSWVDFGPDWKLLTYLGGVSRQSTGLVVVSVDWTEIVAEGDELGGVKEGGVTMKLDSTGCDCGCDCERY